MGETLIIAFAFIAGGLVAVPLATRFGLGSVLGYLIAGVALSPLLAAAGVDVTSIQHFAEFGVVMMLFLVGLELEPRMLWELRNRILGLGGLQVVITTVLVVGIALALGQSWQVALACGLILSLSSTAIVLQTLGEKGLMRSDGGQSSFTVLLFQDIAVIPMLALLPLLAAHDIADAAHGDGHGEASHGISLVDGLPAWQVTFVTLGAVAAVVVIGAFLVGPLFRFVAQAKLRELFIATALAVVVGIAIIMELVGLSPALGAFVAGVVLANSPYRHELESDIDPIRGLLLGLFFITVGAGINFATLADNAVVIVAVTLGLIVVKAAVLFGLARVFKVEGVNQWLLALGLAQAGEFGFVLLSFTTANGVLPQAVADQLLLVVTLSMMMTPILFIAYERLIAPRYDRDAERDSDEITEQGDIIVAGHGRVGAVVNRMLLSAGQTTTVLDFSSDTLERLKRFGIKAFYGDATRPDMMHAAGIESARALVVAIDDDETSTRLVEYVTKHYPQVKVVARAKNFRHVFALHAAGADRTARETFDSAVRLARMTMEELGLHPFEAELYARTFVDEDASLVDELMPLYDPELTYDLDSPFAQRVKKMLWERDRMMLARGSAFRDRAGRGWNPPSVDDAEVLLRESEGAPIDVRDEVARPERGA